MAIVALTFVAGVPAGVGAEDSISEARALFQKVTASLGGLDRLKQVRSIREKTTILARTPVATQTIEMDAWFSVTGPPRQRQTLTTSAGSMLRVVTEEDAFVSTPQGVQDVAPSEAQTTLRDLRMSALALAQRAADPRLKLDVAAGPTIGGVATRLLTVALDGNEVRWCVSPADGRILRRISGTGASPSTTDYSDFRAVQGMTVAYRRKITISSEVSAEVTLVSFELNPAVDAPAFARPKSAPAPGGSPSPTPASIR
jgi:hypothetical protein